MGVLYKALRKIFRFIKRKIKKAYFDRKLNQKRIKAVNKRQYKKAKNKKLQILTVTLNLIYPLPNLVIVYKI